jgi:hypothetical protein
MGCPQTSARACGRRVCCAVMGHMLRIPSGAPGELEHIAPLERDRGTVRHAEPAISAAIGGSGLGEAAPAQEQAAITRDGLNRLIVTCATDRLADAATSRSSSWRSRRAGPGAAKWRGCASSNGGMSRRRGSIRTTRNRLRCRASQSSSAGPGRATPTRRPGCFWSALRSGVSRMAGAGRHHEGADLPGDRPLGSGGSERAHAAVDQSDR